jgi:NAD(P)-dependent dehydrogenase (short-subunit alcohol dehydrogenase family)
MSDLMVGLVTGAAGDIGFSIARRLAARGIRVVLCDRLGEELQRRVAADEYRDLLETYTLDLGDAATLGAFADSILKRHGRVDVLVNNAAKQHDGDVRATSQAEFAESFGINLMAPFLLCKILAPAMCEARNGNIVNISSVHGLAAGPDRCAYATMKAGLLGLTRSMATDLGKFNVRVNAVVPTAIRTTGLLKAWTEERSEPGQDVDRLYNWARRVHPLGRIGEADEVAELVEFLATTRFVTGETIRVDGGLLAALRLLPPPAETAVGGSG